MTTKNVDELLQQQRLWSWRLARWVSESLRREGFEVR